MTLEVIWSDAALEQAEAVLDYIAYDSPSAAERLRERFEAASMALGFYPYSHRAGRLAGTRELVAHPNYILVYTVTDHVRIVSVVHSRQLYP